MFWRPVKQEIAEVRTRVLAEQRATQRARRWSVADMWRARQVIHMYPHLPHGAALAVAQSRLPLDSEPVKQLSRAAAREFLETHPGGFPYGSKVNAARWAPGQKRLLESERWREGGPELWRQRDTQALVQQAIADGVYDPDTGVLIQPEASSEATGPHVTFWRLMAKISEISDKEVPFVGNVSGKTRLWNPTTGVMTDADTMAPSWIADTEAAIAEATPLYQTNIGQTRLLEDDAPRHMYGSASPEIAHAISAGILRGEEIHRPVAPTWDNKTKQWVYANERDRQRDERFFRLMRALAEYYGDDEPIPYIDDTENRVALYHPRTGLTEMAPDGSNSRGVFVDLPGEWDNWWETKRRRVFEAVGKTRLPDPFGTQQAGLSPPDIKGVIQGATMALDAPVQEAVGQFRNVYQAVSEGDITAPNWFESQSDLGVAFDQLLSGEGVDAGGGWFVDPESEVARERLRREAKRGQIAGHNITVGRALAHWVPDVPLMAPDEVGFQIMSGVVDAGVQLFADPTSHGLSALGKTRRAKQLFAAPVGANVRENPAGLYRGLRRVFNPVDGKAWLDGPDGTKTLQAIANETDPYKIWVASNRKLPPDLTARLADATTPEDVRAILEPELGISIRRVSTLDEIPKTIHRDIPDPTDMPAQGPIDAWDRRVVAEQVEAHLANAKVSHDTRSKIFQKIARSKDEQDLSAVLLDDMANALDEALYIGGVQDERIRRMITQLHKGTHREQSTTFKTALFDQNPTAAGDGIVVNGEEILADGAQLWVELAPRFLTLPDARAIRRLVSNNKALMKFIANERGELRWLPMLIEGFNSGIFKPFALMRAAWTVRVVGEEQLRMAAAGYDNFITSPLSAIAWRLGSPNSSKIGKALGVSDPATRRWGRAATDWMGEYWEEIDEFRNALASARGTWVDYPGMVRTSRLTDYWKDDLAVTDQYVAGWGQWIGKLHADPVSRHLATHGDMEKTFEWFMNEAGQKFRRGLAKARPGKLDSENQVRQYLRIVQEQIDLATGGSSDLLRVVRTGKLGDLRVFAHDTQINNDFVKVLREQFLDEFGPESVRANEWVSAGSRAREGLAQAHEYWNNKIVDRLFGVLMTERTNNLSRSPTFRQAYWKRGIELMPAMTTKAQAELIEQAKKANLSSRQLRQVMRAGNRGFGDLSLAEADMLAKAFALDETKWLLYDLSKRGRTMDMLRVVFPFGEAWKEVISRWFGKDGLIANRPEVFRRFQQAVQGARGPDFGELMGAPMVPYVDPDTGETRYKQGGFFWKNEFGDEVFIYPATGFLSEKLLGVPVPLTGTVEGMSMFGDVMPGLGPVVQIPTAWLLQTRPGPKEIWQSIEGIELPWIDKTVEDLLLPFGAPGDGDPEQIASLVSYAPPYIRSFLSMITRGDVKPEEWGNVVIGAANARKSTGEYGDTPAEVQRLIEDAEADARKLYPFVVFAKFIAPSSPSPDWRTLTKDGEWVRTRALAQEFRRMQQEDYDTATERFVEKYGIHTMGATVSKTVGVYYGVPVTYEGAHWVEKNPEVKTELPSIYGFFAPQPKRGEVEIDYSIWQKQLKEGDRVTLTPKQWARLVAHELGQLEYEARLAELEDPDRPTKEERDWLREWRLYLREEYYGYRDQSGMPKRPDDEGMILEAYRAVEMPQVLATPQGKALKEYLEYRDAAMETAKAQGFASFREADALLEVRIWLRDHGEYLAQTVPEFEPLWDILLSREVRDIPDEDELADAA